MNKKIDRHRTAIDRYSLSAPMQSLYRHNYLSGNFSLLDYGCGKGDDVRILKQHNVEIAGWDPVFFPDETKDSCDIVNLGFVINVIEDQKERQKTLHNAFAIARKLLVVAVMLGGESIISRFKKLGDGVITSRNTFQKYYSQQEIRNYVESVLKAEAIAVGPGIFYVFKDKIEEQIFLVSREKAKKNWQRLSYIGDPDRLAIKQRAFYEKNRELLDGFWRKCLELGRIPLNKEFTHSEDLRTIADSHKKAFRLLAVIHGQETFESATESRKNDLLVYFALGLFGQRRPYLHMPESLKRDIKVFWGVYTKAIDDAKNLLFSVGKKNVIKNACLQAYETLQCGQLITNHSFIVHRELIEDLPSVLRIYIGCASQLYGDLSQIDLIKVHMTSGKVTLLCYDDFWGKPLPLLTQRVKIKLREQDIDFFDYGDEYPPQPLYLKGVLMKDYMPNYSKQKTFDKRLQSFNWLDLSGFGPSKDEFDTLLLENKLQIKGFRFYKIAKSTNN